MDYPIMSANASANCCCMCRSMLQVADFFGEVVDLYGVDAGCLGQVGGELLGAGDGVEDKLARRAIDTDTVALDETTDEEFASVGEDDVLTVAILVGLGEATYAEGKATVVLTQLYNGLVVLKQEIDIAIERIVD